MAAMLSCSFGNNVGCIAGSFPRLHYHADVVNRDSERGSSMAALSCHVVKADIFSHKREGSQRVQADNTNWWIPICLFQKRP